MSKIAMQIKINSKASKVWEVLADIGGVSKWSPAILESRCTTEANGGLGALKHHVETGETIDATSKIPESALAAVTEA